MEFIYAQLNEQGYCIGISSLGGKITADNMIKIDEYDTSYLGRKYNLELDRWTNEYYKVEPIELQVNEHEQLTKETHTTMETTSLDNLINMDMLIALDEKLNTILEHLGL